VFPAKYRRAVFDEAVDGVLRDVCLDLERRYQLKFMENRNGEGSCAFFGAVGSHIQRNETGNADTEHRSAGDILLVPSCEETVVGWGILD
jgi:hypothetical protein